MKSHSEQDGGNGPAKGLDAGGVAIVAVTREVPGSLAIHVPGVRVELRPGPLERMTRAALLEHVRGAHVIVSMFSDRVDAEMLDAAGPQLRGVCNLAVGFENIDLKECARRGVAVSNTPNAVTEGTADLAWMLILAVARRLIEGDEFARSGAWERHGPLSMSQFLGLDLTGRTLLIVGAGRIGYATALRSLGWGMQVLYTARSRHWEFELAPLAARRVELDEGLRAADVVSIHTPLTDQTRHLIGERELSLLKPTAILVNTSRGPVVDEDALVRALEAKQLWGAGLDVFEHEPRVHEGLRRMKNVVMMPHVGSAATKYRAMMTEMVSENASAMLAGREPPNRVV